MRDGVSLRAMTKYDHREMERGGISYRVESGGSIPLSDTKEVLGYCEVPKGTAIPGPFHDFTEFRHAIEERAIHHHWKPGVAIRETFLKQDSDEAGHA